MGELAVKRRVVHVGGFHATPPEANLKLFRRCMDRFQTTWRLSCTVEPKSISPDWHSWRVTCSGDGWHSDTEHYNFRWDDVVSGHRARTWATRLPLGLLAFVDFILNGALWRYLRVSWRYALFFLYPFEVIALLGVAAYLIAKGGLSWSGLADEKAFRWGLAAVIFGGLLSSIGNAMSIDYIIDNWIYSRSLLRNGDPAVEQKLVRLADEIDQGDGAELLIVGHSLGAVHALELIAILIARRPDGAPIRLASVGSSILKLGLHSHANRIRETLERVAASSRVIWVDFTSINDVMNFYKAEPISTLGLSGRPAMMQSVRFRPMLHPKNYKRIQCNLLKLHNQFINGSDRRARYDYLMMLCGPFRLETIAVAPEGAVPWIDQSGGLTDDGSIAAA